MIKPFPARLCLLICFLIGTAIPFHRAEAQEESSAPPSLVFPDLLRSYYSEEPIELAVSALPPGETATLLFESEGSDPLSVKVTGAEKGASIIKLAPYSLAPGRYSVSLNGEKASDLVIASGAWPSEMLVSQTGRGWKNFHVSNAFGFGFTDRDGLPTETPRQSWMKRKDSHEINIQSDLPSVIYMYWTGYVLHKPWGKNKEWASADIIENMRVFNYHVAQRMRRYGKSIYSIGSLDEPGLPWGKTAAGGAASGFTGWNVADWLAERGFDWTDDPGSLPRDEFLEYMRLRGLMLKEAFQDAHDDIKEVWPEALYATDAYAPHAVGDGTDPMNQEANDIPTTHVFVDWGLGKLGAIGGMYLEKAHDPTAKIAHAMNGQLFGARVTPARAVPAYRLMINSLLAAGLDSNWWLNFRELRPENTERINEPVSRIGSIFDKVEPSDHDIAILWSDTEIRMRVKGLMQAQASQSDGEQIALMVADMPEDSVDENGKIKYNAYSVGSNYKGELLTTFTAMNRAGYPAHFIDEELLDREGTLDAYKVLMVLGQKHALPESRRAAIDAWVAKGGQVVVNASTEVEFTDALTFDAPSVVDQGYAWGEVFSAGQDALHGKGDVENRRDLSLEAINYGMEQYSRDASPIIEETLAKTEARQLLQTDSVHLGAERHVGNGIELWMVINAYEELPQRAEDEAYPIYNYAPYFGQYILKGIDKKAAVYLIDGTAWNRCRKIVQGNTQYEHFEGGEMKLYLVLEAEPEGLTVSTQVESGKLIVDVKVEGLEAALPVRVEVAKPDGTVLYSLDRATDGSGTLQETLPLGANATAGTYLVTASSPIESLSGFALAEVSPFQPEVQPITDLVQVFDEEVIKGLLAQGSELAVAWAGKEQHPVAKDLVASLKTKGVSAKLVDAEKTWSKSLYPRVWDPYMNVYAPSEEVQALPDMRVVDEKGRFVKNENGPGWQEAPGKVLVELNITSEYYETPTVTTLDGEPFTGNRMLSGTLLNVVGDGYISIAGTETFYEPGTKLFYHGKGNNPVVINGKAESVKTTDAFRQKWQRPWLRIIGHNGAHNLTPQLPEAISAPDHMILLGDSQDGMLVRALQASELLPQVVDEAYPGNGKALIQFAWSPFALGKNVIYIGASDIEGLTAGAETLVNLATDE